MPGRAGRGSGSHPGVKARDKGRVGLGERGWGKREGRRGRGEAREVGRAGEEEKRRRRGRWRGGEGEEREGKVILAGLLLKSTRTSMEVPSTHITLNLLPCHIPS